jgi:hypothetical protein
MVARDLHKSATLVGRAFNTANVIFTNAIVVGRELCAEIQALAMDEWRARPIELKHRPHLCVTEMTL